MKEIQFRDQMSNIRKIVEVKNKEGISNGFVVRKVLTDGVMASCGRWSAWGADRVLAKENLMSYPVYSRP